MAVTYPNGKIPAAARLSIDIHGRTLLDPSARAWLWVVAEVKRRYGWTPEPSTGYTAYRTFAEQDSIFRKYFTTDYNNSAKSDRRVYDGKVWYRRVGFPSAATPGYSNHGWGRAVDVSGLQSFTSTRYKQFKDVATEMGFDNVEGISIEEFWHWVHDGKKVPPAPPKPKPIPEDDVAPKQPVKLNNDDQAIKVGTWTNVWIDEIIDEKTKKVTGHEVSLYSDSKNRTRFNATLNLEVTGIPVGKSVKVRCIRQTADGKEVDGAWRVQKLRGDAPSVIETLVQEGDLAAGLRLRWQILVEDKALTSVIIRSAEARAHYWAL